MTVHANRLALEICRQIGGHVEPYSSAQEEERVANGNLISASPDLLEAARLANQELLALGQGSSASPALRALWSAIAKAEGRSE